MYLFLAPSFTAEYEAAVSLPAQGRGRTPKFSPSFPHALASGKDEPCRSHAWSLPASSLAFPHRREPCRGWQGCSRPRAMGQPCRFIVWVLIAAWDGVQCRGWGAGGDPTDAVDAPGLPSALFSCLTSLIKRVVGVPGLTAERHGKPGTHTKDRPHEHCVPSRSLLLSFLGALSDTTLLLHFAFPPGFKTEIKQ